jgi:hypothetical protein
LFIRSSLPHLAGFSPSRRRRQLPDRKFAAVVRPNAGIKVSALFGVADSRRNLGDGVPAADAAERQRLANVRIIGYYSVSHLMRSQYL